MASCARVLFLSLLLVGSIAIGATRVTRSLDTTLSLFAPLLVLGAFARAPAPGAAPLTVGRGRTDRARGKPGGPDRRLDRVAVIGAGPAGLTAAYVLGRRGVR